MRTKPDRNSKVIVILLLAVLAACTYDSREEIEALTGCDISAVTFERDIKPILEKNCTVCHSGPSPANGLDLEALADIMSVARDGTLAGAINHLPGYEPMPRFAPKLPRCEIMKIEKWIVEGAMNN